MTNNGRELMTFIDFMTAADAALKRPLENRDFQRVAPGTWNLGKGDDLNVIGCRNTVRNHRSV